MCGGWGGGGGGVVWEGGVGGGGGRGERGGVGCGVVMARGGGWALVREATRGGGGSVGGMVGAARACHWKSKPALLQQRAVGAAIIVNICLKRLNKWRSCRSKMLIFNGWHKTCVQGLPKRVGGPPPVSAMDRPRFPIKVKHHA